MAMVDIGVGGVGRSIRNMAMDCIGVGAKEVEQSVQLENEGYSGSGWKTISISYNASRRQEISV